jgi:hypothetical protein
MGLSLNEVAILADWIARHGLRGHIATIGVPALHFSVPELNSVLRDGRDDAVGDAPLHATDLYRRLGFEKASYVDVSDYEGAGIILDLGAPEIPTHLHDAFDVVFDCGTLEHVFHLPNALHNMVRMAAPGGHVMHVVLMDNGVDHGFYQLSPTLFFDWFEAAGLEVLEAAALSFDASDWRTARWSVRHVRRGTFGGGELGLGRGETSFFMILARKTADVAGRPSPIQYFYRQPQVPEAINPRWFPAYRMQAGVVVADAPAVRLGLTGFVQQEGHAWACALPDQVPPGSDAANRCGSDLLLLENGRPLGPSNAPHAAIRARGRGAYSHWGRNLVFSASDNSIPLANGRHYEALFAGPMSKRQGT